MTLVNSVHGGFSNDITIHIIYICNKSLCLALASNMRRCTQINGMWAIKSSLLSQDYSHRNQIYNHLELNETDARKSGPSNDFKDKIQRVEGSKIKCRGGRSTESSRGRWGSHFRGRLWSRLSAALSKSWGSNWFQKLLRVAVQSSECCFHGTLIIAKEKTNLYVCKISTLQQST